MQLVAVSRRREDEGGKKHGKGGTEMKNKKVVFFSGTEKRRRRHFVAVVAHTRSHKKGNQLLLMYCTAYNYVESHCSLGNFLPGVVDQQSIQI